MLLRSKSPMHEEVPAQVILKRFGMAIFCVVAIAGLIGCSSSSEPLQGKEKADMEKFLKEGIPASKSPAGGSAGGAKPSATPTDE